MGRQEAAIPVAIILGFFLDCDGKSHILPLTESIRPRKEQRDELVCRGELCCALGNGTFAK
jgi:hypothetical protein